MICSVEQLVEKLKEKKKILSQNEIDSMKEVEKKYPLRISDYYFHLVDFEDRNCPIFKQCIPDIQELENRKNYGEDPLKEGRYSVVPHLVHKYYDRAAFIASDTCNMFCRHCTRKNTAIQGKLPTTEEFLQVLGYLKEHSQIRDVLITGGDPLCLPMEKLEYYIGEIRKISSVQTIRIGTRLPVVDPEKITEELADMLKKYHPVWIFTQFNHSKEITKEAAVACDRLLCRGIPLGNQSVFLKGINDNAEEMEKLLTELIRIRVRPYYLYQCDKVMGTEHFLREYQKAVEILEEIRYRVPGYAVPKFVIDADGEYGGKVTIEENHILEETEKYLILKGKEKNTTTKYYK